MCGHVGVAGTLRIDEKDFFSDALWAGALRGMHNTGIARVDRTGETVVTKVTGCTPFLGWEKQEEVNKISIMDRVLLGHNRHATRGTVTDDNAHPFEFDRIVGAHNGTLNGVSSRRLARWNDFGTDSQALYHDINVKGIREVIPNVEGAWALVFYDKEEKTINFLRNNQREFHYALSEDGKRLYWASEGEMLRWILKRNKIAIAEGGILRLSPDTLVTFKIPDVGKAFESPTVVTDLKGYEYEWKIYSGKQYTPGPTNQLKLPPPAKGPGGNSGSTTKDSKKNNNTSVLDIKDAAYRRGLSYGKLGYGDEEDCPYEAGSAMRRAWVDGYWDGRVEYWQDHPPASDDPYLGVVAANATSTDDADMYPGPNGTKLTLAEFERKTNDMCGYCTSPIKNRDEALKGAWFDENTFICHDCIKDDPTLKEMLH